MQENTNSKLMKSVINREKISGFESYTYDGYRDVKLLLNVLLACMMVMYFQLSA